ncbi:MAG: MFS transporter [Treponema sp.]|jgi:oligogalacturonide transporter|nr:MFS transporter [Treponema sp.]
MGQTSLRTKILFGAGDMFGGGSVNLINFFYLIFLTDVVNIRPVYAGAIFLCSKIWDAVSDPLMGIITDNTRSRFGRRRPYFFAGIFFIFISYILLWLPVNFAVEAARVLYVLAAYLFFNTVFTMVMVPYYAMSAEISSDYNQRTLISNIRLAFSMGSSILCALIPMIIVRSFENIRMGYVCMSVVFGLFFSLPFIGVFMDTRENAAIKIDKFSIKIFVQPFKIKTFRLLVMVYVTAFLTLDIISVLVSYYMKYYMMRSGQTNLVLGTVIISQILCLPFYFRISKKIGKNYAFCIGAAITIIGITAMSLVSPGLPLAFMYIPPVIVGAGLSAGISMPWAMFGDVTDVGEFATGLRNSGSFSGIMTFVRKVCSAIAVFLITAMIDSGGYIRPIDGVEQIQPDSVIFFMRLIIVAAPLLLLSGGIIAARCYPLNEKTHNRLRKFLDGRANGVTAPEEEKELKDILV